MPNCGNSPIAAPLMAQRHNMSSIRQQSCILSNTNLAAVRNTPDLQKRLR